MKTDAALDEAFPGDEATKLFISQQFNNENDLLIVVISNRVNLRRL